MSLFPCLKIFGGSRMVSISVTEVLVEKQISGFHHGCKGRKPSFEQILKWIWWKWSQMTTGETLASNIEPSLFNMIDKVSLVPSSLGRFCVSLFPSFLALLILILLLFLKEYIACFCSFPTWSCMLFPLPKMSLLLFAIYNYFLHIHPSRYSQIRPLCWDIS